MAALDIETCSPDAVDFCIIQGNSFEIDLEIVDDVGAPQNISGWTFNAQIRNRYADDALPLLAFTESARNDTAGTVTMRLEALETETAPYSKTNADLLRWDVEADDGTNVTTIARGDVLVIGETTRLAD